MKIKTPLYFFLKYSIIRFISIGGIFLRTYDAFIASVISPYFPRFGGDFFEQRPHIMARPSKLTEKQWTEIERRHLAGESMRSLAAEFRISEAAIRKRVSARTNEIKDVAAQLVEAEQRFMALPVSSQISARTLADELKAISGNLASAASYGAMTAHKLAKVAHIQAAKISEHERDEVRPDDLKGIAALTNLANQASNIGLGLMVANKDFKEDPPEAAKPMTLAEFYGSNAADSKPGA